MTITAIKVFHYALGLKKALTIKGNKIEKREGLLIELTDDQGHTGIGEISPLPGLSKETLAVAQRQILRIRNELVKHPIPKSVERCNGDFARWLDGFHPTSSVRFGIETAVINLKSVSQHQPMARLISDHYDPHVYLNALLSTPPEKAVDEAKELVQQGFHAIKVKVGSAPLKEDIALVKAVSDAISNTALLRVDANQAWEIDDAIKFGEAVGLAAVEYIEEPLKDISQIPEFYNATTIPVALDESLSQRSVRDIKSISGVEVLIIKPTIQGGLEKSWQIIQEARGAGIEPVLSSTFETGAGIVALANLAACFSRHVPMGLDTRKWFERDILLNDFPVEKGYVDITNPALLPLKPDYRLLTEISE